MAKTDQFMEHYAACFGQPSEWRGGNPQGIGLYFAWVETVDIDLLCRVMERLSAEGEKSPKLPRLKAAYNSAKSLRDGPQEREKISCFQCEGAGWNYIVIGIVNGKRYTMDPQAPCKCDKNWIEVVPCTCKAGEAQKGAFGRKQREIGYQFALKSPMACRDYMARCYEAEPAIPPTPVDDTTAQWAEEGSHGQEEQF